MQFLDIGAPTQAGISVITGYAVAEKLKMLLMSSWKIPKAYLLKNMPPILEAY